MGKRTRISSKITAKDTAEKKIFFNYATIGPVDRMAHRAASDFLNDYLHIGPPEVLEKYDIYSTKLASETAKLLNCSADEITYIKNTTEGIIIASESLPLEFGDEVLLMGQEYPANILPWLKKKKDGLNVKILSEEKNDLAFSKLIESITPKTKVVSISWGQYYDGYLPDLQLLSKVCKENNVFLVIDGVHGIGTRKIDLQKIHVDILSCGGQKTIGALPGIGFMYINKSTLSKLNDFKVGIRSVKNFDFEGYEIKDVAERFQDGTQNLIGVVSLYAAIRHINALGIENIEKKNLKLLSIYKKILYKNKIEFIDHKNQANIISLKVSNPVGLVHFLRQHGVYIKTVKDVARISFTHSSNVKDFNVVVKHIRDWSNSAHNMVAKIRSQKSIINSSL